MNEREKLLRKLSAQQFAAWETALFLNTHPNCDEALKARREYVEAANRLRKEYTNTYGMLNHNSAEDGDQWQWVCDPWPWDLD